MDRSKLQFFSVAGVLAANLSFATGTLPVNVAANGIDSPTCGSAASPCRTITQALALAPDGGSVAVGPGVYGDVHTDSQLSGSEEEPGTDDSVITITKPVRLYSTQGAAVTVIEGGYSRPIAVRILSANVIFGGKDAGFTITGTSNVALAVSSADQVSVVGNVAVNNSGRGFLLFPGGVIQVSDNYAIDNGNDGFFVNAFSPGYYATIARNTAIGNGGDGFRIIGANATHQVISNIATNNNVGFEIFPGPSRVSNNKISANNTGILFTNRSGDPSAAGPTVTRNNIVGSKAVAVSSFLDGTYAAPKFRDNNITGTVVSTQFAPLSCGMTNLTSLLFDASNNYWGASSGPGAKPADAICSGPVQTVPFATKAFLIQ